jgi:hypothetical protein
MMPRVKYVHGAVQVQGEMNKMYFVLLTIPVED